jgi:hypothetical protein
VTLASTSTGTVTFNPVSPLTIANGSSSASFTYTDTQAGTPTITAASTSPSTITSATQQETVTKATPSITGVTSQSTTYGTTSVTLLGTVSATGGVYPAIGEKGTVSATINGHTVTGTFTTSSGGFSINYNDASLATDSVGGSPYTITYAYAGDANLTAANNNTGTALTITKATPTLSVANSPVTYNGSAQAATVSGSVGGTASNVKYNGSTTAPTDVGTYAITADFVPSDTTDYNSLSGASAGNFVIYPQLSGTSDAAGLSGYVGNNLGNTIMMVFIAKDSGGNIVGSNEVQVATTPGGGGSSFTFTIGVPSDTATISLKPRFYLRKLFDVTVTDDTATINLSGVTFVGGDANGDNQVDGTDYAWIRTLWMATGNTQYDINGDGVIDANDFPDLNGDGIIDALDYAILESGWYQTGSPE